MKFKNYIWDFDGTLFDSYPHICECLLKILEQEGIRKKFDEEMIMRYLRVSFGKIKSYTGICGALVNYYPRLPDGTNPACQSRMDYVADSLSELWEGLQKE